MNQQNKCTYVATKKYENPTTLSWEGDALCVMRNGRMAAYPGSISCGQPSGEASHTCGPCDSEATKETRNLYRFLKAVGDSDCVMYGHQNDLVNKTGNPALSHSDTYDCIGTYPAVMGWDVLALVEVEFSAVRHSKFYETDSDGWKALPALPENILKNSGIPEKNLYAAASLANRMLEMGTVLTLSAHMPNFLFSAVREDYREGIDPTYAKYQFREYTPNRCEGDVVGELLKGGRGTEAFYAYLDIVVAFAKLVKGPFIFRPFHENTGSWFWWGENHCTPEQFKALFRLVAEYLWNNGVHNILLAYSPGEEPKTVEAFAERFPGPDYVDLVGIDMYDPLTCVGEGEKFFAKFRDRIRNLQCFAEQYGLLMAVTETGLAGRPETNGGKPFALRMEKNENPQWFMQVLEAVSKSRASYFLLWANFDRTYTFYEPFVEEMLPTGERMGHETLDAFIEYASDPRTLMATQTSGILGLLYGKEN